MQITTKQQQCIRALCQKKRVPVPEAVATMSKQQASECIDELMSLASDGAVIICDEERHVTKELSRG